MSSPRLELDRVRIVDAVEFQPIESALLEEDCLLHHVRAFHSPEEEGARRVEVARASYWDFPLYYAPVEHPSIIPDVKEDMKQEAEAMRALGKRFEVLHALILGNLPNIPDKEINGFLLLDDVRVVPEYQRQGVGSHLVHGILRYWEERGPSHAFAFPQPPMPNGTLPPMEELAKAAKAIHPFLAPLGFTLLKKSLLFVIPLRNRRDGLPTPRSALRPNE